MGSLLALSLLAAACGDDDDGDDAAADESAAGGTTTTTAPDYELEEPLRIVAVISERRRTNAVPDYVDGIEMAIAEITQAGGSAAPDRARGRRDAAVGDDHQSPTWRWRDPDPARPVPHGAGDGRASTPPS